MLHIVTFEFGHGLGAEGICTGRLTQALRDSGERIRVITSRPVFRSGPGGAEAVRAWPARPSPLHQALGRLLFDVGTADWAWCAATARSRIDRNAVVYGRGMPLSSLVAAQRLAERHGVPLCVHLSDPLPSPWLRDRRKEWDEQGRLVRRLARSAQLFTFTTTEALTYTEEHAGVDLAGRSALVRNIVPEWQVEYVDAARRPFELGYFGTFAGFNGRRSPYSLLDGALLAAKRGVPIALRFVGTDGDGWPAKIRRHVGSRLPVQFLPRQDVRPHFATTSAVVSIDADEPLVILPTKTGEAVQAGLRVLLISPSGSPAANEFGGRWRSVRLCASSPEAVADAIAALAEVSQAEALTEIPARRAALAPYRASAVAKTLIDALRSRGLVDPVGEHTTPASPSPPRP